MSAGVGGAVPSVWDSASLSAMLIRCGCGRLQEARDTCIGCGSALPVVERLDARAVQLRQGAVVQVLTSEERHALAVIVSGLGLVSSWWNVRVVHDVFVLLAGERRLAQLMSTGLSRTRGMEQAAAELGVAYETLRGALNRLVLQKGVP